MSFQESSLGEAVANDEQISGEGFPLIIRSYPGKRAFDILLSVIALILMLPLLGITAALIWAFSPGPILYRGLRAGLRGKPFWQLKFRTMTIRHSGDPFTSQADPRVTPIGKILRLFRIDELPQIINILKGEMSWVGPRPEDYEVVLRCYSPDQLRVLSARPGLTGSVQVKSFPGLEYKIPPGVDPQRYYEEVLLPQRLAEDIRYVENMSFWLDLKILCATLYCVLIKSWSVLLRTRKSATTHETIEGEPCAADTLKGPMPDKAEHKSSLTRAAA
jgi:lipopolysaccharide/colanic/teichoic acid biosynthesis glycosyltransferase